jgi:ABC-type bacteriocin/lantibiotic exporter with double-glycine peptidase domain
MKILSQRDPKWGQKTIGKTGSTLRDYGCTLTSISMLSDWYGCYQDPGQLAKNLRFLKDLILWQSVTEKLCFRWVWRAYKYDETKILASLKGKTTSCLLQVRGNHWVVGIRKVGNHYWVADPWDGKRKFLNKSVITGSSHFEK